ncbi:hypothetical protein MRX96_055716 [Rhipicephalus microplus]
MRWPDLIGGWKEGKRRKGVHSRAISHPDDRWPPLFPTAEANDQREDAVLGSRAPEHVGGKRRAIHSCHDYSGDDPRGRRWTLPRGTQHLDEALCGYSAYTETGAAARLCDVATKSYLNKPLRVEMCRTNSGNATRLPPKR